jgi:hypothetical protein
VLRLLVAVQLPLVGSYSSALVEELTLAPPATRTWPLLSRVAVCRERAVLRLPVLLNTDEGTVLDCIDFDFF